MEKWTAGQIGDSFGAYSGRKVDFVSQGIPESGTLTYSSKSPNGPWAHLTVDGEHLVVNNDVTVTVL